MMQKLRKASVHYTSRTAALVPVKLFLLSLIFPFILQIGDVRLSVYRIVLIGMILPIFYLFLVGRAGRIRLADVTLILFCMWAALSFSVVHGLSTGLEAGGILFIETMGPYLLARIYIRDHQAFKTTVKVLVGIVLFFSPFAVFETLTGENLLLEIMDSIWPSYGEIRKDPRWGLERVQATFEHPILFGVFCGSAISLAYLVYGYGKPFFRRAAISLLVFLTASLSLSAGPLTGMVTQLYLLIWNGVFATVRSRWTILSLLGFAAYLVIELGSNRPAAAIFIQYFSFNEFSAYMRIHIWNFGTASILNHPLFGIGFNEWERPFWMSASIDMFWIVPGVRHGIPAMSLMLVTFFAVFLPIAFRKGLDSVQSASRLGLLFSLTSFFMVGWTVHFWNATYTLFIFFLGSGMWLLDVGSQENQAKLSSDASSGENAPKRQPDEADHDTRAIPPSPYRRTHLKRMHTRD